MRRNSIAIPFILLEGLFIHGCASAKLDRAKTDSISPRSNLQSEIVKPAPAGDVLPASPKGNGVLSMTAAAQLAVSRHPAVAEAIGRVRQQDQMIAEARSGYLPRVSGGPRAGFDNRLEGQWRPVFNLSASQMVYDFGAVASRIDAETAERTARHAQMIGTLDDLVRKTADAVIEVDRYNRLAAVSREHIQDNQRILKLVTSRADRGASTKSDRLQAEARVQEAQSTLLEVQSQAGRWQATLAALTGMAAPIVVDASVPAPLQDACSRGPPDWSKVSSVMKAEADIRSANARLRLSRAEMFPTLSLAGGVDVDIRNPTRESDYSIGLQASASLYDGGSLSARRNAASLAAATAQAAKANAMLESSRSLAEAANQLAGLEQQLKLLGGREQTMKATRDLYEVQYRDLGTRTLLDLLDAADEFHGARFQNVNVEHDIADLKVECTFFSGNQRQAFAIGEPDFR